MAALQKNHRGFTLVELIVSTAILGIITLSVCAFLSAGARFYRSLNDTVRLQNESQLVMTQLAEYTVDCTSGLAWDGEHLYLVSGDTVQVFTFDASAQALRSAQCPKAETLTVPDGDLMAEHITALSVTLRDQEATISLDFSRDGKTYSAAQVIALRNQPQTASGWPELYRKLS